MKPFRPIRSSLSFSPSDVSIASQIVYLVSSSGAFAAITLSIFLFLPRLSRHEPWEELLFRRILEPEQTGADVVAFVEQRLPLLPGAATAEAWDFEAEQLRAKILQQVIFRGQASQWRDAACRTEWLETLEGGPGYQLRKLRFEAIPGTWVPAVLYEPITLVRPAPVVVNVNGHEFAGTAASHAQLLCINLAKRGILALNVEWFGMGQLRQPGFRHGCMNQIDLCGSSGLAPFYLSLKRSLDVLLALPQADSSRVAVCGLSGGGWQTILISSLDPRVALANPVAGFSSFRTRLQHWAELGDSEQTPADFATLADYTHLTALRAPRPTLLTYNVKDASYLASLTLPPLLEAARPVYELRGKADQLQFHINAVPGTHNFSRDNREAFYQFLIEHFAHPDDDWPPFEIESTPELKSRDLLNVGLDDDNSTFNDIARDLLGQLPPRAAPAEPALRRIWVEAEREALGQKIHYHPMKPSATVIREVSGKGWSGRAWRLRLDSEWELPVVEITPESVEQTSIVFADSGRKSMIPIIQSLLRKKSRVIAVDPLLFGECFNTHYSYRFSLIINCVGERTIGIQAGQVAALGNWVRNEFQQSPGLMTFGPRSSFVGLVAATMEPESVGSLRMHDAYTSLSTLITHNIPYEDAPEMFCAGLLETHDLPLIELLLKPGTLIPPAP